MANRDWNTYPSIGLPKTSFYPEQFAWKADPSTLGALPAQWQDHGRCKKAPVIGVHDALATRGFGL